MWELSHYYFQFSVFLFSFYIFSYFIIIYHSRIIMKEVERNLVIVFITSRLVFIIFFFNFFVVRFFINTLFFFFMIVFLVKCNEDNQDSEEIRLKNYLLPILCSWSTITARKHLQYFSTCFLFWIKIIICLENLSLFHIRISLMILKFKDNL